MNVAALLAPLLPTNSFVESPKARKWQKRRCFSPKKTLLPLPCRKRKTWRVNSTGFREPNERSFYLILPLSRVFLLSLDSINELVGSNVLARAGAATFTKGSLDYVLSLHLRACSQSRGMAESLVALIARISTPGRDLPSASGRDACQWCSA